MSAATEKGRSVSGAAGRRRLVLFHHAGCGNHGCEAIVRGFVRGLTRTPADNPETGAAGMLPVRLITHSAAEDRRYLLPEHDLRAPEGIGTHPFTFEEERSIDQHFFAHTAYYVYRKLTGDRESFLRYRFPMLLGAGAPALAVSIGGDNYCYPDMVPDLILADRMLRRQGAATALLGCSVEPSSLSGNRELVEDLKGHRLITARESLTCEALCAAGIPEEQLRLFPDPAFLLEAEERPLPAGFAEAGTVGVNVSPLIENYRSGADGTSVLDAFAALIGHIIETTDLQVALIPHVVWASSDDQKSLKALEQKFRDTGRVVLIGDHAAPVLKGFIARCRFFVGARTHATIAAYSSCVPTLVVGYSVKSEGIARDLFGTAKGHVLPVGELTGKRLIDGFETMRDREQELRATLAEQMPEVTARAGENAVAIARLWREVCGE